MANMSYCRFRNTLGDLQDCYEHMEERLDPEDDREEREAKARLVRLCKRIADDYAENE